MMMMPCFPIVFTENTTDGQFLYKTTFYKKKSININQYNIVCYLNIFVVIEKKKKLSFTSARYGPFFTSFL